MFWCITSYFAPLPLANSLSCGLLGAWSEISRSARISYAGLAESRGRGYERKYSWLVLYSDRPADESRSFGFSFQAERLVEERSGASRVFPRRVVQKTTSTVTFFVLLIGKRILYSFGVKG